MGEFESVAKFKKFYLEMFDMLQYMRTYFRELPGAENQFRAFWVSEKLERLVNEVEGRRLDIVDDDIQRFFRTTIPAYREAPGMKFYHNPDFVQRLSEKIKYFNAGFNANS